MEEIINPELSEFRSLISAIREEAVLLKEAILSDEEEKEESALLQKYDELLRRHAISTLNILAQYQLGGWRDNVDDE
ncbi:MAG: hypothetical protein VB086_02350 [Clostridiaceae bacterium]|nr:hypothetical protein [Clostridiaceae bacterium]